jgi:hypothetical protein
MQHRSTLTTKHLIQTMTGTALLMLTLLCALPAHAQQYLATLSGQVSDNSDARIAKAIVTATESVTKFVTRATTNDSGGYSIPFLAPGTYTIKVEYTGFRTETRTGILVTAGASVQTDFALQVGATTDNVVVNSDAAAALDTASANLGTTLGAKEVTDLPNVGRNPFVLSTLSAGVTTGAYMQSKSSGFTNPFSGTAVQILANGSAGHNRLTLDGIPDDPAERLSGAGYTGFVPSPEAVQEVKTQTAIFDAQFGHGNGTVLNTVLRSGSNKYHGSAYYVFRNTYLNANLYERVPNQNGAINPAAPSHRVNDQWSQPGFVLDGPISIPHLYNGHDKTFFMVAYERIQLHQPVTYNGLLPTAAQRSGDFSALCSSFVAGVCAAGAGQQIYDPAGAIASNGDRTPFLNNIIPANRITAAGAALLKLYPLPNSTGNVNVNYISSDTSSPNRYFSFVTRIDHSLSQNNKFNATFFKAILNQIQPREGYPTVIAPAGIGYTVYRNNMGGSFDFVSGLKNGYNLDARIGVIYHPFGLIYPGASGFDLSSIGITGTNLPYQSFPGTSFSDNYGGLAAGAGGQISEFTLGSSSFLVSRIIGKHALRLGFEGNLSRYNVQNPNSGLGVFFFNRQFTQKNSSGTGTSTNNTGGDVNSGNPIAALALGYPSSGTYGNQVAYALQQTYQAYFLQDDWRITSKLTLNAGIRWDYESPFTDRFNRLNSSFCTSCPSPLQASVPGLTLLGGLQFVSGSNRFPYSRDLNNVQPRIGLAYQTGLRTVVRGGFGIIYFNTLESPIGQGFSSSTSYVATTDNTRPANNLSNPFPAGVNLPTGSTLGLSTQLGQAVAFSDPNHVNPRMLQYSVSTQTQLPANVILTIAYVGNKVSQLEVSKSINGIPRQYFNQGAAGAAYLTTSVNNPFAGQLPGSSLNAAKVNQSALLTPFPQFTNVSDNFISKGEALYNSLQVSGTKRLSHGLTVIGNFTWSKIMDKNTYLNGGQDSIDNLYRYQDPNPNLVANIVAIYQFTALSKQPAYIRLPFGGWQMNSILRAQNASLVSTPGGSITRISTPHSTIGQPYTRFFNTCYADSTGKNVATVLNTDGSIKTPGCDAQSPNPAFQQNVAFTLNTVGPYNNDIRQRVHPLMDLSIFKKFTIKERASFEIRAEFFNVLNTANFGGPGTTPGSATYGLVTLNQANDPRLTQLTARINF